MPKLPLFWISCISCCLSCIDPLEFNTSAPPQLLVIDGGISTASDPYTIRLSYATEYGKQIFDPVREARIVVSDDANNQEVLEAIEPGIYQGQMQGVVGRSYQIEITLPDGNIYRSRQEKILPPVAIDSLSFHVKIIPFINDQGGLTEQKFAQLNLHTKLLEAQEEIFLRWDWESVFVFYESSPNNAKICYVAERLAPQSNPILDGSTLVAGSKINQELFRHIPDYTFNWRRSYYVWQYRISKEAYTYRAQLEEIANPEGNIFDPTPAPVRGNVYNVNNPQEFVAGYFEASSVDTSVLFVTRPDIAPFIFLPVPCGSPHPPSLSFSVCADCLLLENSTLQRPGYWP